jgi:ribosomal protein uL24
MNPKSRKARKQRAFSAHLPLHLQQKRLSVHTNKALRKETKKRGLAVRKGDTVQVLRGAHRGKSGKITKVSYASGKVYIEKLVLKKATGKEAFIPFHASNLLLTELNREDEARFGKKPEKGKRTREEPGEKTVLKKAEKAVSSDIWAEEPEEKEEKKKTGKAPQAGKTVAKKTRAEAATKKGEE